MMAKSCTPLKARAAAAAVGTATQRLALHGRTSASVRRIYHHNSTWTNSSNASSGGRWRDVHLPANAANAQTLRWCWSSSAASTFVQKGDGDERSVGDAVGGGVSSRIGSRRHIATSAPATGEKGKKTSAGGGESANHITFETGKVTY